MNINIWIRKIITGMNSWLQKYKPQTIDDVLFQSTVKTAFKCIVESKGKNMPHLLLYGPTGTGKTLLVHLLVKELYGSSMNDNVMYISSTDELGISTVRKKIKYFSQKSVNNINDVNIKLIIIEDADALTFTAQAALRRIIETKSEYTRFCLTCINKKGIIDPIISRCVTFRLKPIPQYIIKDYLKQICAYENVSTKNIEQNSYLYEGDIRKAIIHQQANSLTLHNEYDIMVQYVDWVIENVKHASLDDIDDVVYKINANNINISKFLNIFIEKLIQTNVDTQLIDKVSNLSLQTDIKLNHDNYNEIFLQYFIYSCKLYMSNMSV